jgi:cytoskeletal protein RodZ
MQSGETQSDFGRYLQACRLQTGRSLVEIAVQTKITISCLQQIENQDLHRLPQDAFVKGLLKSFAIAVGADTEETLRRYRNCLGIQQQLGGKAVLNSVATNFWRRQLIALVLFFLAVGGTLYGIQVVQTGDSAPKPSGGVKNESYDQQTPEENAALEDIPAASAPPAEGPTILKLKASAVANARLKIIADGRLPQEFVLQAGEQVLVTAEARLSILIVNAGAVRLSLNGQHVNVPGKDGQIVTLDLPQT